MYNDDTALVVQVDVAHTGTGTAHDQASRRPRRPRRIGYARALEAQTDLWAAVSELRALKVDSEHIYIDRGTDALATRRPQLTAALKAARAGDIIVAAAPARIARTLAEFHTLVQRLATEHLHLQIGGTDFNQLTPADVLALAADLHTRLTREALEEQQRYDDVRRSDGRGMNRKLSPLNRLRMRELFDAGLPRDQIAALLEVGRSTIYREPSTLPDKH